ncbi:PKD domain-containing protein [Halorhabdus sp. SVX81]|uniref:PKD domain-containing protein n=1 Tax=Halorhabdus sp. SVX81 TaxID=2978283 RepID=UPI0023DCD77D|nr:PKD domain-containing protein [Halorhabdus sp. SVX81]
MRGGRTVLVVALLLIASWGLVAVTTADGEAVNPGDENDTNVSSDRSIWNRTYLNYPADDGGNRSFYGVEETAAGYLFVGSGRDSLVGTGGEVKASVVETRTDGSLVWERSVLPAGTHHRVYHDGVKLGPQTYVFGGTINAPSRFEPGTYWLADSDRNVHTWQIRSGDGAFFDLLEVEESVVAIGSRAVIRIGANGTIHWRHSMPDIGSVYRAGARAADGYVLAGWTVTRQAGGFGDAARIRLVNHSGEREWTQTFGLAAGFNATASRLYAATPADDGFVFGGTRSDGEDRRGWVIATNETGSVDWTHSLPADTRVLGVAAGPDGVVAVGQSGNQSGRVWRFDHDGTVISTAQYGYVLRDVIRTEAGTYVTAGSRPTTNRDPFAVALDYTPPNATVQMSTGGVRTTGTPVAVTANGSTDNTAIETYRWDFDSDGNVDRTTSTPTVTHVYTETGTVTPTVTVVDAAGNADRANASTITLADRTAPTVGLADPSNGLAATTGPTLLDASASTDNGRIERYLWDFDGDGTVDRTTDEPTTRYRFDRRNHTYSVGIGAVDAAGNRNVTTVAIKTCSNDRPHVRTDVAAWRTQDRARARLNATVENDVGTATVTWRLPNGSVHTGRSVAFAFEQSPSIVNVTVTDEYGAEQTRHVVVWTPAARAEGTSSGQFRRLLAAIGSLVDRALALLR